MHTHVRNRACSSASSVAACLHQAGVTDTVSACQVTFMLENGGCSIDALKADFEDMSASSACCPQQAPTSGVLEYTHALRFQPYSAHRCYCQLPISGRVMKRLLQFRLGCHGC